jgi:ribosomal protein L7/L12
VIHFKNACEKQLWISRTMRGDSFDEADAFVLEFRRRVEGPNTEGRAPGVWLEDVGPRKIQVIRQIREYTGLGLRESKAVVDQQLPTLIPRPTWSIPATDNTPFLSALRNAGATVVEVK